MRICVLASGSEGNVTYIEAAHNKILIDLGKSPTYIKNKLSEIDVDINEIDAIIISHTHTDHVSDLKKFISKYDVKVYVTADMLCDLPYLFDYEKTIIFDDGIIINSVIIDSLKSSHDVTDSRNFIVHYKDFNVGYITDTGYINRKYFEKLRNLDVYLFESNHDVEMLMNGSYPSWLKKRVVGTSGHLSNRDSSIYLAKLIGPATKKIVLTHLSKKNNNNCLALETIKDVFAGYKVDFSNIVCAEQDNPTEVINL